jgi:hypothetical protein
MKKFTPKLFFNILVYLDNSAQAAGAIDTVLEYSCVMYIKIIVLEGWWVFFAHDARARLPPPVVRVVYLTVKNLLK